MKKALKIASLLSVFMAVIVFASGCSLTDSGKKTNTNKNSASEETSVEEEGDEIVMATEDAFGEDMADIERYPGSIRTYYAKDSGEIDLTYETTDTEQQVRDHYTSYLEGKGWKQTGIATDYIDFEKGDENNPEILTVYFTPYEDEGILEYELVYSPPLTEEELSEEEDF
jgi:hypothetical protein